MRATQVAQFVMGEGKGRTLSMSVTLYTATNTICNKMQARHECDLARRLAASLLPVIFQRPLWPLLVFVAKRVIHLM
jgi:hypothetical protein